MNREISNGHTKGARASLTAMPGRKEGPRPQPHTRLKPATLGVAQGLREPGGQVHGAGCCCSLTIFLGWLCVLVLWVIGKEVTYR